MASFFNVGALGTNPFSTPVGQRIEQATDASLASENWALNMEICDMINESSDTARDAMKAIRKRLTQSAGKNNQVIMYTLTVLETCVKNCGKAFHVLVAQKDFIQDLVKLIGPKNDPPAAMQEKVLSLIQIWADAFKNQTDLSGVNQMYMELKNKGIEFPQPDIEHMAPIYTPIRSVPEAQVQNIPEQSLSPQHTNIPMAHNNGSSTLSPEQVVKLQSELEIVSHSMSILSEMLTELKPGQEEPEDYALLTELTATCKEMQGRIVELVGRVSDDELTAELLRLNDELNNLFLRHQRYEKNRSSHQATSPSAVLGAALGVPSTDDSTTTTTTTPIGAVGGLSTVDASVHSNLPKTQDTPLLIDLRERTEKMQTAFHNFGIKKKDGADGFDMLAQSRTDGIPSKSDILKDIPTVDATAGSAESPFKRSGELPVVSKPTAKDNEVDEMEAWLGSSKEIEGIEETLTSTEFDKFLEERAAAAENLPTITGENNSAALTGDAATEHKKKKTVDEENLLAL